MAPDSLKNPSKENLQGNLQKLLLPLGTSLLFAGSFIAGKFTTTDLSPLVTTWLRYLITLIFLHGLLTIRRRNEFRIDRLDGLRLTSLGVFGVIGYHYFFFLSLRHTIVTNSAIINATNPILTALAAAVFLGEILSVKNYLGGVLAFCGVILLLTKGDIQNLLTLRLNLGDGFMLLAVLSWVVYALFLKKLALRYSGFTLSYYAALSGVVLLSGLIFTENWWEQLQAVSHSSLLATLYMGVGASGIGYLQYALSVAKIGPTRTASFVYSFVPKFVALLAGLFFKQAFTLAMGLSMGLIILGVNLMLSNR
ncbi:MAG: DMT family transporter [Microcoleaceae cyanobacterium]